MDITSKGHAPIRDNNSLQVVFFLMLMFLMSIFMLNLFVGVVLLNFQKEKEKLVRADLLTKLQ